MVSGKSGRSRSEDQISTQSRGWQPGESRSDRLVRPARICARAPHKAESLTGTPLVLISPVESSRPPAGRTRWPPVTRYRPRVLPCLGIPSACPPTHLPPHRPWMDFERVAHTRTTDRADVTAGLDGYDWLITSGPGSLSLWGIAQTGRPDVSFPPIIGRPCII